MGAAKLLALARVRRSVPFEHGHVPVRVVARVRKLGARDDDRVPVVGRVHVPAKVVVAGRLDFVIGGPDARPLAHPAARVVPPVDVHGAAHKVALVEPRVARVLPLRVLVRPARDEEVRPVAAVDVAVPEVVVVKLGDRRVQQGHRPVGRGQRVQPVGLDRRRGARERRGDPRAVVRAHGDGRRGSRGSR